MIKLFLFFISSSIYAQIINIPDATFKSDLVGANSFNSNNHIAKNLAGDWVAIDTNQDGEIQQIEALAIYQIAIYSNFIPISDLTGIEYFTNLTNFQCNNTAITSVYFPTLTNLKILDVGYNQITTANLEGLSNLELLDLRFNQLTQLDVSNLNNLKDLVCENNQLTAIYFQNNPLLNTVYIPNNSISNLDVSVLPALQYLSCQNNLLTTCNISGLQNLTTINCEYNLLNTLPLIDLPLITGIYCNNNQMTELNFENVPSLIYLDCSYNQLTGLDFTSNFSFNSLNCNSNNLVDIKIKNGLFHNFNTLYVSWANNPNLSNICVDDFNIQALLYFLNYNGYNSQSLTINSNCNLDTTIFEESSKIMVSPNPTNDVVMIDFGKYQENVTMTLLNVLGQEVSSKTYNQITSTTYPITGNMGLYFLQIENNENENEKKVIKVIKE